MGRPVWNGSQFLDSASVAGQAIVYQHCKRVAKFHRSCDGCDLCAYARKVLATTAGPIGPKPPAHPPCAVAA